MDENKINIEQRKQDHIELTSKSQVGLNQKLNLNSHYEPLFSGHPNKDEDTCSLSFAGKRLRHPLWISSMTGGVAEGKEINFRLAKACGKFGLGMGLGSCRVILEDPKRFEDFNVRKNLGPDACLMANLGIAQLEETLIKKEVSSLTQLLDDLQADGLIIHVNPLQEFSQPEGDRFPRPPIETLSELRALFDRPLMIKEVGQGMGPKSLKALMDLQVDAVELAGLGGTNFTYMEYMRHSEVRPHLEELGLIGHTPLEMIKFLNEMTWPDQQTPLIVVSGGIRSLIKGYEYLNMLKLPGVLGMASPFLQAARKGQEQLEQTVEEMIQVLQMAKRYLNNSNQGQL